MMIEFENTRKMNVRSIDDRLNLRHQYLKLQVHTAIGNNWVMFMIVPTIVSVASSIIVCLYATLRHTELPIYMYIFFPYVGANLFGLLFWLAYEVIMIIRASEAIMGTLSSTEEQYYQESPVQQKLYIRKLARSTRPIFFRIGIFMDFSFDVPVGIWDEIVNQLVFLLTL